MPLTLRRKEDETWLDAALRRAEDHDLIVEVQAEYDASRAKGASEAQSAWGALHTWDLLAFETPGRGGWPIIDGALCCPVCLSTNITFTGRYGPRGRLGDPGAWEINKCEDCGETRSWASHWVADAQDGVRW